MRNLVATLAMFSVLALSNLPAVAQAPATISFQGLLEFDGAPADTMVGLTFRLLDDTTASPTIIWTEVHPSVVVENGIFNVILGSITPLESLEFSKPLWLEIEDTAEGSTFGTLTELTAAPYAMSLVLPQIHDVSIGGTALTINNTGNGFGIKGETHWETGRGLYGQASAFVGENRGVYGFTASAAGTGVYGIANTTVATNPNYGVYGTSNSNTGFGVYGIAPKTGVYGTATADAIDAFGIKGETSTSAHAVYGFSTGSGRGVFGQTSGTGRAGHFEINNTGNSTEALFAWTNGTGSAGHFQIANGGSSSHALEAATSGSGYGLNAEGGSFGVRATSTTLFGVGVSGETAMSAGTGVRGLATAASSITFGVLGESSSPNGQGVRGEGGLYGVYGEATTQGTRGGPSAGVYGVANAPTGNDALAGLFDGYVHILDQLRVEDFTHIVGNLLAGENLTVNEDLSVLGDFEVSGTKDFRIDHPLDPANKYLHHFAIESNEVLNVYSGNVTTNEEGHATVSLPEWFGVLNKDFRYQLTVLGTFARAIVAEEIRENRFVIQTDEPDVKVSWQVSGVRNDPHLQKHPPVVETEKPVEERGTFVSDAYVQE